MSYETGGLGECASTYVGGVYVRVVAVPSIMGDADSG